jgi:F-type H+-transporting ATPase subunit gamma
MAAQLRQLRRRIRSVQSTKKITRASELIAASRIAKARQRVEASKPYANELTRALSALASLTNVDHPLLNEKENPERAAILIITSDRGLCGAYNSNVLRTANELGELVRSEGKEPVLYLIGRKGVGYYSFRGRDIAASWTGFSEMPNFAGAREAGQELVSAFLADTDDENGVDEIHLVYTEYVNALTQRPVATRIAPLVVEERPEDEAPEGYLPEYEFEPEPELLLAALLPKYLNARTYAALLDSAASESASRQRAMKSATDNADTLITDLSRMANAARQAEITQEISEIVGGANALATEGSDRS